MASHQEEFKATFNEIFASLISSGLSNSAAAAKALLTTQEILKRRQQEEQQRQSQSSVAVIPPTPPPTAAVAAASAAIESSSLPAVLLPSSVSISAVSSSGKNVSAESSSVALSIEAEEAAKNYGLKSKPITSRQILGIEISSLQSCLEDCRLKSNFSPLIKLVGNVFSSPDVLYDSFTGGTSDILSHLPVDSTALMLDIHAVSQAYESLISIGDSRVLSTLSFALESLVSSLGLASTKLVSVKPFIVFFEFNGLLDPSRESWIKSFLVSFTKLSYARKFQFFRWVLDHASYEQYVRYLTVIRQFMTLQIYQGEIQDARRAAKFLGILYDARTYSSVFQRLPVSEFYNDPLNEEYMQSREGQRVDFSQWVKERAGRSSGHGGVRTTSHLREVIESAPPITLFNKIKASGDIVRPAEASTGTDMEVDATEDSESSVTVEKSSFYIVSSKDSSSLEAVAVESSNIEIPPNFEKMYTLSDASSFIGHPFVLAPSTKATILELDAALQMRKVMDSEIQTAIVTGQQFVVPYFVLRVSRERIVMDTISQVMLFEDTEFKKPLKIIFDGEEGVDAGGVRKEFYQVMTRQLFDPGYGMFKNYEESRLLWFNSDSLESTQEFELIGLLIGVAIFNSIIIDLKMPMVVYKKLKQSNYKSTLADLATLQPSLAQGLHRLLEFDGDVESVFGATFSLTYEFFGENRTVELVPGGASIPVTTENRAEYVALYVNYLLDISVEPQFRAFERGFRKVCGGAALDLFEAAELELLICGNMVLDFNALREGTKYADGFDESSRAINWLWTILLDEFDDEERRLFLKFISGSDRSPIDGLSKLEFVISKNGTEDSRLPSAHTCFNHLLLPDYSSLDAMREKLKFAIYHSEGFGLR